MSVSVLRSQIVKPNFEDLVRRLDVGIAIYEPVADGADFRFIDMNPAALRTSRTHAGAVIGKLLSETFSGAETMGIVDALRRVHRSGRSESLPPLHYVDDLRDGWYRCDVHRLDGGQLAAMYVDVTQDYLAPSERQRRTLDAVFRALPDLFLLLSEDGRVEDFRGGTTAGCHATTAEVLARPLSEVLPARAAERIRRAMSEARRSGELVTTEYSLRHDGTEQYFEGRVHHTADNRFAVIVRDISHGRRFQHAMEERVRELEGLYRIYRTTQTTSVTRDLVRATAPIVANAMRRPEEVFVRIEIDGEIATAGASAPTGRQLQAQVHDGAESRGRLCIDFAPRTPPLEEERRFVEATAMALGLWVRGERDRRSLETYEKIVSNTQDQLALVDAQLRYRVVNTAYAKRIGCSVQEIIGRGVRDVLGSHGFGDRQEAGLHKALEGATVQYQEWRDTPDGQRYMNMLYSPYAVGDEVVGVIVSIHDITDLHAAQAQLRRAARVFSSSAEAVVMTDAYGTITDVNEAFSTMFGYAAREVIGTRLSPVDETHHDVRFRQELYASLDDQRRWRGEVFCQRSDGHVFPCLMTLSAVEDEQGDPSGYVSLFSDLSAIKENERRLETLAHQDPLTGLANRIQLRRHVERRVERAGREGSAFTVMFIDLDHFKEVNDTLGHGAGDELLRLVTKRLLGALRADDTLARIGGDEFVAVLPGIDSGVNASVIARKIIGTISEPFRIGAETVHVSASIGICCYPVDGSDGEALLRHADRAMYAAKENGRAGWQCYRPDMDASVAGRPCITRRRP